MNKSYLKKTAQELQDYLAFGRRGSKVQNKNGKGSYKRDKRVKED